MIPNSFLPGMLGDMQVNEIITIAGSAHSSHLFFIEAAGTPDGCAGHTGRVPAESRSSNTNWLTRTIIFCASHQNSAAAISAQRHCGLGMPGT